MTPQKESKHDHSVVNCIDCMVIHEEGIEAMRKKTIDLIHEPFTIRNKKDAADNILDYQSKLKQKTKEALK